MTGKQKLKKFKIQLLLNCVDCTQNRKSEDHLASNLHPCVKTLNYEYMYLPLFIFPVLRVYIYIYFIRVTDIQCNIAIPSLVRLISLF